jgi:polyphosphate kinase 2 (PPK2 family)
MEKYMVKPGETVRLSQWDPGDKSAFGGGKKKGRKALDAHTGKLVVLQERLYAENHHKILIVLQGMDTAGKDGTIRHVFEGGNPQGVRVACFSSSRPRWSRNMISCGVSIRKPLRQAK